MKAEFTPFSLKLNPRPPAGLRMGGKAPQGVRPPFVGETTRYFLTVALGDGSSLSLFTTFEEDGKRDPLDRAFELVGEEDAILQSVIHRNVSGTEITSELASTIPSCEFALGKKTEEDPKKPYEFHKLGGIAHFEKDFGLSEKIRSDCRGFSHLLQVAFPLAPGDDVMAVTWPFGQWVFHVLYRPGKDPQFIYCWS